MNKKLFLLTTLLLGLGLSSCSNVADGSIVIPDPFDDGKVQTPYSDYDNGKRITKVNLDKDNVFVNLDNEEEITFKINATYEPSDAYNSYLFYSSSNEDVAIVDEEGIVTALDNGEANISVTSDEGVGSTCHVTVYTPVTALALTPHTEEGYVMDIYETRQFYVSYTPEDTNQGKVNWSLVDENGRASQLGTISDNGFVSIVAPKGTKNVVNYVVATSYFNEEIFAKEKIIINDERVYAEGVDIYQESNKVSESTLNLNLGESLTLTSKTTPETIHTEATVTWSSDSDSVSVVDGVVTALKAPASAVITVRVDSVTNWVKIDTQKIAVESVMLSPQQENLALTKGETATLTPTVLPNNASIKDVSYGVISGNQYVSVDENGLITALASGIAQIKVSSVDDTTKFALSTVTVTNKIQTITIVDSYSNYYYGANEYQMSVSTAPTDCDPYDVTWSVDDTTLATINSKTGLLVTNNDEKTGTVKVTVVVDGTSITDTYNVVIKEPAKPFEANKQYLAGNRNFDGSAVDYNVPSWDNARYARELTLNSEQSGFKNEWYVNGITLYAYNSEAGTGDQFIVRSADYNQKVQTNSASNNKLKYIDGTTNFTVTKDDEYNLYFQELKDDKVTEYCNYTIYAESVFAGGYYLVGNRDFSSGTSTGEISNANWIKKASSKALTKNQGQTSYDEYMTSLTLTKGDEFRIRNADWFDIELKDGSTSKITKNSQGNFVVGTSGEYTFYFAPSYEGNKLYIAEGGTPTPPATVNVTFTMTKQSSQYGRSFAIVGDFCSWTVNDNSYFMKWSTGDVWTVTVPLAPGTQITYKVVEYNENDKSIYQWEGGSNRTLTVSTAQTITLNWQ